MLSVVVVVLVVVLVVVVFLEVVLELVGVVLAYMEYSHTVAFSHIAHPNITSPQRQHPPSTI